MRCNLEASVASYVFMAFTLQGAVFALGGLGAAGYIALLSRNADRIGGGLNPDAPSGNNSLDGTRFAIPLVIVGEPCATHASSNLYIYEYIHVSMSRTPRQSRTCCCTAIVDVLQAFWHWCSLPGRLERHSYCSSYQNSSSLQPCWGL